MFAEVFETAKLIVAIAGGLGIAWYWNNKNHKLARYRYLDEAYKELLVTYLENPHFGDPALTGKYLECYGKDEIKYEYFAMTVHTVMETLWDVYGDRIPDEWVHVFKYHTKLHANWLRNNSEANRPGYVQRALAAAKF